MADPNGGFSVKINGLAEVAEALRAIPDKLRRRAIRNALAAGGRVFRDQARRLTPVLQVPVRRRGRLVRKPGTVRNAIVVRTSKRARRAGDVGVFVNVRPAKGFNRGANNPFDPFYWRWLEFGARGRAGRGMLTGALRQAGEALSKIQINLGVAVAKLNFPKAPAP